MTEDKNKCTEEAISENIVDILVTENKRIARDTAMVSVAGWAFVIIACLYMWAQLNAPLTSIILAASGLVLAHQIIMAVLGVSSRMSRKLASLVSIVAIYVATYDQMNARAIGLFFGSMEEKTSKTE